MSQTDAGTVEIEVAGETHVLQPTLDAFKKINRRFGGLRPAAQAVADMEAESMAFIIAAGADLPPKEVPGLMGALFKQGIINAAAPLSAYLSYLMCPSGASNADDEAPDSGNG